MKPDGYKTSINNVPRENIARVYAFGLWQISREQTVQTEQGQL